MKLSLLGTGSDVGKSIAATALCRILARRGIRVAPFKAQNLSNNSFITPDGGEIGRAQAAQAEAAGLVPSVHFNPVLIKPMGSAGCQVVVHGKVFSHAPAYGNPEFRDTLRARVMESFRILENEYDAIVIEGAGSCCEVNLRQNDIVNFDFALRVGAPVVLLADIDRGGVFAQIAGTLDIIDPSERDLVAGFLINKFRGDAAMFRDGMDWIESRTQKPVLGLVPFFTDINIDPEDSMSLESNNGAAKNAPVRVAAARLPNISNFTDLEALAADPEVSVTWLDKPENLESFHAVILPGSKSVIRDMKWLANQKWADALKHYAASGGAIVGLCGGFQMLGKTISDPGGVDGETGDIKGFGLLDIDTFIEPAKITKLSKGADALFGARVQGYEIHKGRTRAAAGTQPFLNLDTGPDGAVNENKNVIGTYLHGLFDSAEFRDIFIRHLANKNNIPINPNIPREDHSLTKQKNYDRLADHFEKYSDIDRIIGIMSGNHSL